MAIFEEALDITLRHEGGYVNDPNDLGGETYRGVARTRNPTWAGWQIVDRNKNLGDFPKSLDSDAELQSQIRELYKLNYWDRVWGDQIVDQAVAATLFDFGVNAGPGKSIELAQSCVGVDVDGIIGPNTLAALNGVDPKIFLPLFTLAKIKRYIELCEHRSDNKAYFYGWVKRALAQE